MTTAPTPLLITEQLTIGYAGRVVVKDLNLSLSAGEYWVLVGANGQGKSTFVQTILGTLRPLAGRLRFEGGHTPHAQLGFVPQSCRLAAALPTTVREFVTLGMVNLRLSRQQRHQRLQHALSQVMLADQLTADYQTLSGGQRQRALIARALVRHPSLLILDEPTTGLDVVAERALLSCVAELNQKQGLTVMFVTHDLDLIDRYATHVMLFKDGAAQAGPVHAFGSSDALAARLAPAAGAP